ncbi:MAG: T9SS type A sorting domain-containing protein [Bacteroidales bacterium]
MKKLFTIFLMGLLGGICSKSTLAQDVELRWTRSIDSLRQSTGGTEWIVKTNKELLKRKKAPYMELAGGSTSQANKVKKLILAFNNLSGKVTKGFNYVIGYDNKTVRTHFYGDELIDFSNNKLTDVSGFIFHIGCGNGGLGLIKLDHNLLSSFNLEHHQGAINFGIKHLDLRCNLITNLNSSNLFISFGQLIGIDPDYPVVKVDNNYLKFTDLIDLRNAVFRRSYDYYHDGSHEFTCYPQRKLGGESTVESIAAGGNKKLSFTLEHSQNQYKWIRNGFSNTVLMTGKEYEIASMDESKAGVYNCIVTNEALPGVILYSYDMAVWMPKENNKAPTSIALSNDKVCSNFIKFGLIGEFTGEDPDKDQLYFRLIKGEGDTNNVSFRIIDGNTLVASEELCDYEQKSSYTIRVQAYDSFGGVYEQNFTISRGEGGSEQKLKSIALKGNTIQENLVDVKIGEFETVGVKVEKVSFSLEKGKKDNDLFVIDGNTLKSAAGINYEKKKNLSILLTASVGDNEFKKVFPISVLDGNDAPEDIILSNNKILEKQNEGSLVGFLMGIDQDPADTEFAFELVEGIGSEDNDKFTILNNTLKTRSVFVYNEQNKFLKIRLKVTDAKKLSYEKSLQIEVISNSTSNEDDFVIVDNNISENLESGTYAGKLLLESTNEDEVEFSLIEGALDNDFFTLNKNKIFTKKIFDYENRSNYRIKAQAKKGDKVIVKEFIIEIGDLPESPYALGVNKYTYKHTWNEDFFVGLIFSKDPDLRSQHKYTLADDCTGADFFKISNDSIFVAKSLRDSPEELVLKIELRDGDSGFFSQSFVFFSDELILGSEIIQKDGSVSEFNVYPNPCKNNIKLSYSSKDTGDVYVEVIDIRGVRVSEKKYYKGTKELQEELLLEPLDSGIFFIKIRHQDQIMVRKIIVE